MQSFRWQNRMRFHQADPAGWMFFGRAFELAHDCMEDLLVDAGFAWRDWFANKDYAMPIRQAQADYRRPIPAGAVYDIEAFVRHLGETSVGFEFIFRSGDQVCLVLQSTHVLLNLQTQKPEAWPTGFRQNLSKFLRSEEASV